MRLSPTILALAATLIAAEAVTQTWTQNPAAGPASRQLPGMVYDLARAQTVLFGGYDTGAAAATADTWLYDGTAWTQAFPTTTPPPLDTFAMTFDIGRGLVTMFGGVDSGNFPASITADTWEWDGSDWTLRSPAASPSPRSGAAMAYDGLRGVTVMFGGSTPTPAGVVSDTWEWDGVTWTQRFPATTPPFRTNHGMAFDFNHGTVVMFGGSGILGSQLGDTWEYDGTDWSPVVTAVSPGARTGHGLVYDLSRGATVLFGGSGPSPLGDTWELRDGEWHEFERLVVPGGNGRVNMAMTYDLGRNRMVMFGGAPRFSDTWEFGGAHPSYASYGIGCTGSAGTPQLDPMSLPAIGGRLDLEVSQVPGSTLVFLASGLGASDLPIPGTSCRQWTLAPLDVIGAFAAGGVARFSINIPASPALAGLAVNFQSAVVDPVNDLGLTVSNAGRAMVY